ITIFLFLLQVHLVLSINTSTSSSSSSSSSATTRLFPSSLPSRCPSPPCVCHVDSAQRKYVTCVSSSLDAVPVGKMDPGTSILNITAPSPQGPFNSITLGRLFYRLPLLTEVHITRSQLPAIGHSTFCPSALACSMQSCNSSLRLLNLSSNSLALLRGDDFNCLSSLEILDLSENLLSEPPSAVFRGLVSLETLRLGRNRLASLVPLMFYGLGELRLLDLSGNPLTSIGRDDLASVPSLKRLLLNGCQLTRLEAGVFDVLNEHLFTGLHLDLLDLSSNLLNPLTACTFCGSSSPSSADPSSSLPSVFIKALDLSGNKLTSLGPTLLEPIAHSLEKLTLDRNTALIDPASSLSAALNPLRRLRYLSAAGIHLNNSMPDSIFDGFRYLSYLNLSSNALHEISGRLLGAMISLEVLDVSGNRLNFLDPAALQTLQRLSSLERVYFGGNPFSCYRCHILPFIDWLANSDPSSYWNVCKRWGSGDLSYCAQCATPESLEGRYLHEPELQRELEWCTNPEVTLRLQASEPQVGLILAFLIILSLIAIILVIVALYRKHGSAVYYTQEDKEFNLSSEKIYTGGAHSHGGGGGGGDRHTSHVNWTHTGPSSSERMVSLTSTGYTISRQNTAIFSPQSSLEQGGGPGGPPQTPQTPNPPESSQMGGGACSTCETAVKQVITSLPALEEAITASINGTGGKLHSNGTFKIQGSVSVGTTSVVTTTNHSKSKGPPSRQAHVKLPPPPPTSGVSGDEEEEEE
ncbi:hypothetical protein TYRP_021766, partial [Tyrophagus putrescentiae]